VGGTVRAGSKVALAGRVAGAGPDGLELGPGDRLLDVGCGTGAAVRAAARIADRAVGVDLSRAMIERAREMARALEPGGRLAIGDGCADLRAARVADWLLRRFQPGHVRLYRSEEMGEILRAAGFARLEIRRLWDGGYVFVRGVKP